MGAPVVFSYATIPTRSYHDFTPVEKWLRVGTVRQEYMSRGHGGGIPLPCPSPDLGGKFTSWQAQR